MLLEKFKSFIKQNNLFTSADKLLIAVSGGVDSVVLCELCYQAGFKFSIAHCNFKLRGEESERDEEFVKKLGEKYDCDVLVKRFDTEKYAADKKLSIQEAARELRYNWFDECVSTPLPSSHSPLAFLLTAHQADDNIETLLMSFFRGTGLKGLKGIPVLNGYLRRPLLPFFKEELIEFAKHHQLKWVEDSSNQSSKYTRNYFRNEIIPSIEKVYPQVKGNLKDNIRRFTEIDKLYQLGIDQFRKKLTRAKGNEIHVPVKQLMAFDNNALYYEMIRPYGFHEKQVAELVKLSQSDSGKYIQSPDNTYRIIRHRHWFIISPVQSTESENIIIIQTDTEIEFALGTLRIGETTNFNPEAMKYASGPTQNSTAVLDNKLISYPLLLRKWKTADYFYPLGMKKKKKISRFLIDQKLSKTDKEKIWVIESEKRICWVVGHRIDERFKITEKTKQVLRFELLGTE